MKRTICNAIITIFLAAGAAQAAEPAKSGQDVKPAETSAIKPAEPKKMPMEMHRQMGMHGKHEGMGMGMECGMMGGKAGGMGCCGQDAFSAVANQELIQVLRDMLKVQEELAESLKGKDKARVMKELDQAGKRLDQLQTDFRSSLAKGKGCKMPCGHGAMEKHDDKGVQGHAGH